jgi:tol-pal system protein YbgF
MRRSRPVRYSIVAALALLGAVTIESARAQDNGDTPAAAQLQIRIQQLEDQIRSLTGQIETQDHQIQVLTQQLEKLRSDTDLRLNDIEAKTGAGPPAAGQVPGGAAPEAAGPGPEPSDDQPAGPQPASGAPPRVLGTIPAGSVPTAPPAAAVPPTPQQQYEAALELYHHGNYAGAEAAFRSFLAQYPKDPLAGSAAYWHGEGYFIQGKFKDAVGTFADAAQKYPTGAKAPDTLLELGKSLDKLGRAADACAVLGQIGTKFPKAPQTVKRQAQQEKTRLRCS